MNMVAEDVEDVVEAGRSVSILRFGLHDGRVAIGGVVERLAYPVEGVFH